MKTKFLIFFLIISVSIQHSFSQKSERIGIIDMEYILSKMEDYTIASQHLEEKIAPLSPCSEKRVRPHPIRVKAYLHPRSNRLATGGSSALVVAIPYALTLNCASASASASTNTSTGIHLLVLVLAVYLTGSSLSYEEVLLSG